MNDHQSLVNAIKQVDVVICSFGRLLIEDQVKIIAAIKEAGNIKVPLLLMEKMFFLNKHIFYS